MRLVGIPVVISGLAIGALALYASWHEIEEVYDAQLIHASKVLRRLTQHRLEWFEGEAGSPIPETGDLGYKYEQNIAFRVWHDGTPIAWSANAVAFGDLQAPPGLSDQQVGGEKWRFFVHIDAESDITVETAERYHIRYELIGYLLLGLLLPASLFIPCVLAVVWVGTTRGLRPLANLSHDVDARDSDDLEAIRPTRTPREISALIAALNRLFERLERALEYERDFTDNAAHELRTPLAAIKAQAQALHRRLQAAPAKTQESLANLEVSIGRATHLVENLLSFSRLQKATPVRQDVNLSELLAELTAELAPEAVARGQDLSLDAEEDLIVRGDRSALRAMVRNLVENAIKYSPPGADIRVLLGLQDSDPLIQVVDNGPGIPDSEKARVLERFYRLGGEQATGSGLGLAIATWVAEQHRARLSLCDVDPTGLCCTVRFQSGKDD